MEARRGRGVPASHRHVSAFRPSGGVSVVASPRASALRGEAPIVVALTVLLTIVSLVPPGGAAIAAGVAAFALTVIAWQRRAPGASSLGLLFVTCLALALVGIGPQQVVFGLAFAVYAVVASRVPWFREATCWLSVGHLDGRLVALSAAFAAISGATLLLWYVTARPISPISSGPSSPTGRSGCLSLRRSYSPS